MRVKADGMILYANPASRRLLELWNTQLGSSLPDAWRDMVKEVYELNNRKIVEVDFLKQTLSFVLVPVRSDAYINMYGTDITQQKEVDQIKNEFISMVSHQLRTPLTSVRWYSEMMLKSPTALPPNLKEIAETIHDTAISLTNLVNDLLSISRMESGKIKLVPQRGDVVLLTQQILKEISPVATNRGVTLELTTDAIPQFLFDPQLIKELMMNLISNAVKYSPKGGKVTILLQLQNEVVTFTVTDQGIGIPKAAQKDIFQRFYRAQNAVDANIDGTGLGLAVARMIAEKSGGKIWFESEPGIGTSFHFTLPVV
jgi:signal transduction histidine kinase